MPRRVRVWHGDATVLVVDDERKIRDTVRAFLERQHYAVLVAASGQEALDVAGRLNPDLAPTGRR
jgi:DNA-binding response OmpR family regulator